MQERAQERRVERVEDAAHLVVAGDSPRDVIDAAQIALFGHALLFEVKERGRLERKHGEGAFQSIRQLVAGITGPVVGKILKFGVQLAHQFVKCKLLL